MATSGSNKVSLMLDSGAYSAWTRGEDLVLDEYIAYSLERQHLVDAVVSLDTIPGKPNVKRTDADVKRAAVESHEKLERMRKAGIEAMPVFHQGEDFKWLIRYIEEGNKYIGISPSGDVIRFNRDWLDECFYYCTNDAGEPIVKTHGFGVSSPPVLARYPWYSADSATWALKSGYGSLLIPRYNGDPRKGGQPDYALEPCSIWVTGQTRDTDRADYHSSGEYTRACVDHFLEQEVGTDITVMMYHPHERMRAMLVYYQKLQQHLPYTMFGFTGGLTFGPKPRGGAEGLKYDLKKVITAVGSLASPARAEMMNKAGVYNRLASYWEIRDLSVADLERYVTEGTVAPWTDGGKPNGSWGSVAYENFRKLRLWDKVKGYRVRTDEAI